MKVKEVIEKIEKREEIKEIEGENPSISIGIIIYFPIDYCNMLTLETKLIYQNGEFHLECCNPNNWKKTLFDEEILRYNNKIIVDIDDFGLEDRNLKMIINALEGINDYAKFENLEFWFRGYLDDLEIPYGKLGGKYGFSCYAIDAIEIETGVIKTKHFAYDDSDFQS